MRKARNRVFTLNGRKFTDEKEYLKARDAHLGYEDEQTQAMRQYGFCKGYTVLAGERSKKVMFN